MAKGAPLIGVMTWFGLPYIDGEELDRSPRYQALIRTETTSRMILFGDNCPIEVDGNITLRNLERIDEAEWKYLVDHAEWATAHAPHMPDAAPKVAINRRGKSVW